MQKIRFVVIVLMACLMGCTTRCQGPKEHSYAIAMQILRNPDADDVFRQIETCEDVVALRIISFTAYTSAWPMEAGPDVDFDSQLDRIFVMAMHRLFIINSKESNEAIEYYKSAFPPDGIYSLFFTQWEEERRLPRNNETLKERQE